MASLKDLADKYNARFVANGDTGRRWVVERGNLKLVSVARNEPLEEKPDQPEDRLL